MTTFALQLKAVKDKNEDFEWYPTTDEIIATVVRSISCSFSKHWKQEGKTFLDIGAGNGKVIKAVAALESVGKCFAIEKSPTLLNLLPKEVMILGVDFWKTSLVDKGIDILFSNPPYTEYESWMEKIVSECPSSTTAYLVVPDRWEKSETLQQVVKARKVKPEILGSYDFLNSEDRKARAKVHLLKLKFQEEHNDPCDPFTKFFNETFTYPEPIVLEEPEEEEETRLGRPLTLIESLCRSHDARIVELQENYKNVCKIPWVLLQEFDISKASLIESLRQKLATLKHSYWRELFNSLDVIQTRLTRSSAEKMLKQIQAQTGIDFNMENVFAVVEWVIKNAYSYFDTQLVETYEKLVEAANIEGYKSNQRVFTEHRFAYNMAQDIDVNHYRLKVGHRMVLHRIGGLSPKYYSCDKGDLSANAATFLGDLITVANNLGFTVIEPPPSRGDWDDSKPRVWNFKEAGKKPESLFRVRTFFNNNTHIQLHPDFVNALNIQHGKLKGWLRNDSQAADELDLPEEVVAKYFASSCKIELKQLLLTNQCI